MASGQTERSRLNHMAPNNFRAVEYERRVLQLQQEAEAWGPDNEQVYFAIEDEVVPGIGRAATWSIVISNEKSEASPWFACTQIP